MRPVEENLSLLAIMLEEIEAFLLSEEIFWPLTAKSKREASLPRLTLGAILLILDELKAQRADLTQTQSIQLEELRGQVERAQLKWPAAIERKAKREYRARLNLWKAYLQDIEQDPEMILDYAQEVRNRVIISRLSECIDRMASTETDESPHRLDQPIWSLTSPGDFIWDKRLMAVYPSEKYPYLYRQPRAIGQF
jgi:hypothetical protein